MEQTGKYCPEHPDEKVVGFQEECRACNKPLQDRKAYTEKPDPPKVEDLGNTVYDPRVEDPDVEKEKRTVAHRLAELDDSPLTAEEMEPIIEGMKNMTKSDIKPEMEEFKESLKAFDKEAIGELDKPEPVKRSHHKGPELPPHLDPTAKKKAEPEKKTHHKGK